MTKFIAPIAMEQLTKYFPDLTRVQADQYSQFIGLFGYWNDKINLVSRKDYPYFTERHLLPSLAIARAITFMPGTSILDVGTGGGLPGLPLAVFFPHCRFLLMDSIGKKIKAVKEMIKELKLDNVTAIQSRVESYRGSFDFICGRAVSTLPAFHDLVKHMGHPGTYQSLPNGILYLKGGDVEAEIAPFGTKVRVFDLSQWFTEPYFTTKKLLHLRF